MFYRSPNPIQLFPDEPLATHLLEQGIDIRVIQVLLGHAKLDTTALYARVATNTIRAVMSPLDRIRLLSEDERQPDA